MCKRFIDWLPLTQPQQGTQPATQACALTGWELNWRPFGAQAGAQSTESHPGRCSIHQPGLYLYFFKSLQTLLLHQCHAFQRYTEDLLFYNRLPGTWFFRLVHFWCHHSVLGLRVVGLINSTPEKCTSWKLAHGNLIQKNAII